MGSKHCKLKKTAMASVSGVACTNQQSSLPTHSGFSHDETIALSSHSDKNSLTGIKEMCVGSSHIELSNNVANDITSKRKINSDMFKPNQNGLIRMNWNEIMANQDNESSKKANLLEGTSKTISQLDANKPLNADDLVIMNGEIASRNTNAYSKKKSFTIFSKSSKLKDFLANKSKRISKNKSSNNSEEKSKETIENKDVQKVEAVLDEVHNEEVSENSNNDKLKNIFRINKTKLTKLQLPSNKNNKIFKENNIKKNKEVTEEMDDVASRISNNSMVTPSPTQFSPVNTTPSHGDEEGVSNRPLSFDIKTRDLPEIPVGSFRGGIKSAEISHQHQKTLQQSSQHSLQHLQQNRPMEHDDLFIESFNELKSKGWYWGPLSWKEAEEQLRDKPIGSFLVRDSSDERYILSLSFKSEDQIHHTRIEHYRGQFSFNAQPRSHGAGTIVEFIEKAIENCTDGSFSYFLRPKGPGLAPTMVRLTNPVSRLMKTHSLQHLCRSVQTFYPSYSIQ